MAAMPCAGGSRLRAFITKVEKAKKTPAISPQPSADKSFNAKYCCTIRCCGIILPSYLLSDLDASIGDRAFLPVLTNSPTARSLLVVRPGVRKRERPGVRTTNEPFLLRVIDRT
ncbi:hypothetical protein [Microcoleus sp. PH2017_27_LUM_O_A]|nr:hypothetical protein [Microcoleus sp. PH2017_27_LUM_O_A]